MLCAYSARHKFMNAPTVYLWVYIVLLVAGGLMGFLKGKSKISLLMSGAFAVVLALCALNVIHGSVALGKVMLDAADITLLVLLVFFGMRFLRSKKFMPMGMLAVLTVVTLALRQLSH